MRGPFYWPERVSAVEVKLESVEGEETEYYRKEEQSDKKARNIGNDKFFFLIFNMSLFFREVSYYRLIRCK